MLVQVSTDIKRQRGSKLCLEFYDCTATDVLYSTTASSQLTHHRTLSPCHTMPLPGLIPHSGGDTNTVSRCWNQLWSSLSAASQGQTAVTTTAPPIAKATLNSDYCFITRDHHVSKLIFTEILICVTLTYAIKSSKYLFTVYKYSCYKPLFLYCGPLFIFLSI